MNTDERELLDLKFKGLKAEIKSNHDLEMIKLQSIENQTMKTNGRVTDLEKETRIVRTFEKHPMLIVLVFLGLIVIYGLIDITEIIKLFK